MRIIVLVDGEHYPPVTRWGIDTARDRGHEVVGALLVGGNEKLPAGAVPDLGVPTMVAGADRMVALTSAIDAFAPEGVLDLSDEPVLGYRERMEMASVALARGIPYLGADFRLDPPIHGPPMPVPTLAVIGTGKRTGQDGRLRRARAPGGRARPRPDDRRAWAAEAPPEPQVAEAGSVDLAAAARARPVGRARGVGLPRGRADDGRDHGRGAPSGGRAGRRARTRRTSGRPPSSAAARRAGLLILEGSGSAMPPVPWDAAILVVPAAVPARVPGGILSGRSGCCSPTWSLLPWRLARLLGSRASFRTSLPPPPLPR